ncbi:hypothetical protein BFS06_12405 [Clostridium perfringens]|uniref:Uncharacterized protein n=1 Tax=Clostridium perfringens TaxID=1502 RepID=A0A140GR48_CLOPF|nr:hypothetical protein [Clostridium perfringens]AMN31007.1 hypothetical protein JFP838_pA0091 [Clostridium perfringens]TBX15003.1 hypothetical protein BFS06_12405 [Clostridium perfringens]
MSNKRTLTEEEKNAILDETNLENKRVEIKEEDVELTTKEKIRIIFVLIMYFAIPTGIFAFSAHKMHFNTIIGGILGFVFAIVIGWALKLHKPVDL